MDVEQVETSRDLGVILKDPKSKQGTQYKYWFFTYNNYKVETIETIETILRNECDWYVFQEETGESGTKHLQGTICLKRKQRLSEIKKWDTEIHWENTKAVSKSIVYCSKVATRTGKIYTHNIDLPEEVEVDEPYGWQLDVMEIIREKPDKRTIHWFWESNGCVGKTQLCKYLVVKHDALVLNGKSADMFHMLSKSKKRKLILVDVPRSSQEFINYGAIEMIKNGLIFSGKYDGCQLVFNCPHVIVFSNQLPDMSKMSFDRWLVHEIVVI